MTANPDLAHVDVRYVAELARIALTDGEVTRFQRELDDILQYVTQLDELDVAGIEPMAHATPRVNVMREDQVRASLPRDSILANAPRTLDDTAICVPAVLEEGTH